MTTILIIFAVACALSLLITPQVARVAIKLGLVDQPSERKIHRKPVPRIGGAAIFLAFFISFMPMLSTTMVEKARLFQLILADPRMLYIALGACVAFGLGLFDDREGLSPTVKFGVQAIAALIAYWGGIQIRTVVLPGLGMIDFGWMALPVTVFWVLLVINAVNLLDGLDGLAAGVSFFVGIVLMVLCVLGDRYLVAVFLAAMTGSILGFLRYNFNPAIIFMGDSGSYFLGYLLATLSVLGSIKSQTAVAILIPIVALGVPLIDTMWATVRRFVVGKGLFRPDRHHFHHRLLQLGLTQRHAVLLIYGITVVLGILAIVLVNIRDERAAVILVVLGVLTFLGIRRLGYFDYMRMDRFFGWMRDISDTSGLSHERRSFLEMQIRISEAQSLDALWKAVALAVSHLEFDMAALYLNPSTEASNAAPATDESPGENRVSDRRRIPGRAASVTLRQALPEFRWNREGFDSSGSEGFSRNLFRLELPLLMDGSVCFGILVLVKDLKDRPASHYALKRVEHLRRTVVRTLEEILPRTSF